MKNTYIRQIASILLIAPLLALASTSSPLHVKKIIPRSSTNDTSLCAEVDRYFSASDGAKAKPHIKLSPNIKFTVSLSYDEICIGGLLPHKQYTFTIDQNIPLGSAKLDKSYEFTGVTKDYDPSLSFKDTGYILPAKGDITLPLETTNIDKVSISLYRINHRSLISSINSYGFFKALSSYKLDSIETEEGYKLWQKQLTIVSDKNHAKTTAVPVGDFLKKREAGVYILAAAPIHKSGEIDEYRVATQWFMISDIGLFTLEDERGLHVYTKHLSNAKPYKDVKLTLVAKNNEILGSKLAKDGYVLFPKSLLKGKKGMEAKAVYAYGKHKDFTVLDLSRPAHNLADRGVDGRDAVDKYDLWIYSNRGIFRPGETVPFHLLVRTALGRKVSMLKLSAKLYAPNEDDVQNKLIVLDDIGHGEGSFIINQNADTGRWRIEIYAGSGKPIGQMSFLVEDFVPPKISLEITQKPKYILPNSPAVLKGIAKYLTEDILSSADASIDIILHHNIHGFKGYEKYQFGKAGQSFENISIWEESFKTEENGELNITLLLEKTPHTSLPLAAQIKLSVNEPGGRPTHQYITIPYLHKLAYIGLKPAFENSAVDMHANAIFDIVYLQNMRASSAHLAYRLVEEEVHWNWRSSGENDWEYYKTYSEGRELKKGSVQVPSHPTQLDLGRLDWGSYRLEIYETNSSSSRQETISSYRFTSGYEESRSKASPDKLPISIDKQNYSANGKINVSIVPKFTGPMIISIANQKIIQTKEIDAKIGERIELKFDITEEWGSSAYVLASAFRAEDKKLGATRAIGVAHVSISDPNKFIPLALHYPNQIKSSSTLTVHIKANKATDKNIFVTLAAVDEGVLQITNYTPPNPAKYFYGKKKLGIAIKDIYADLIKTIGSHAEFDVGADGDSLPPSLGNGAVSNKRKVVALLSKATKLDTNGETDISFDIPDYQGSLRLMAVAWSNKAVGSSTGKVIIKDPVSSELYMPKFISVGDSAEITLRSVLDSELEYGKYQFKIHTQGGIKLSPSNIDYDFQKDTSGSLQTTLSLSAHSQTDGTILLDVIHNDKIINSRKWEIAIRAPYPQSYVKKIGLVGGNKILNIKHILDSNASWLSIQNITLGLSGNPLLPLSSISQELTEYQGRCAEQTTSRAMPRLDHNTTQYKTLIQSAIDRVLTMQNINGGIGLWGGSNTDMWISAYVLDFLTTARSKGYTVPKKNIDAGLKWMEKNLNRWSNQQRKQEADVYALYVLAKSNKILHSEILFHMQNPKTQIKSAQAWGHLAATLSLLGEKEKARKVFEKATKALMQNSRSFYSNYGGTLRDKASLVSLLEKSGYHKKAQALFADLVLDTKEERYLSTQEMSTLLIASKSTDIQGGKMNLLVDGKPHAQQKNFKIHASTISSLPSIENQGSAPLWYDLSFVATPNSSHYRPENNFGFSITKEFYDLKGNAIDIAQVPRNSRVVILLKGEIQSNNIHHPLITDWLPAGLEIENPNISGIDATDSLKWLKDKSKTIHNAYRNDRFESALHIDTNNSFRVAYIARAVSVGKFMLAPAKIEDMYQPRYRAFSETNIEKMHITHAREITSLPKVKEKENNESSTSVVLTSEIYIHAYLKPIHTLSRYSLVQLNYLRNGIFAQAGLGFEQTNPSLHQRFSAFDWYRPNGEKSSKIYALLTKTQKENVQKLLKEEKRRCGGLVLADLYRAKIRELDISFLQRYSKQELRILRNSLFARYGLKFKEATLSKVFSNMPWYKPTEISTDEIFEKKMNDLEKKNVRSILQVESQK